MEIEILEPIIRLDKVLETLYKSPNAKRLISKQDLKQESNLFDDEEFERILKKLIEDKFIEMIEPSYFSITLNGVLHHLQDGYRNQIRHKNHLNQLQETQINLQNIQTDIQKRMKLLTSVLIFVSLPAALYYLIELIKILFHCYGL